MTLYLQDLVGIPTCTAVLGIMHMVPRVSTLSTRGEDALAVLKYLQVQCHVQCHVLASTVDASREPEA